MEAYHCALPEYHDVLRKTAIECPDLGVRRLRSDVEVLETFRLPPIRSPSASDVLTLRRFREIHDDVCTE